MLLIVGLIVLAIGVAVPLAFLRVSPKLAGPAAGSGEAFPDDVIPAEIQIARLKSDIESLEVSELESALATARLGSGKMPEGIANEPGTAFLRLPVP
jgi:hypothetical protein